MSWQPDNRTIKQKEADFDAVTRFQLHATAYLLLGSGCMVYAASTGNVLNGFRVFMRGLQVGSILSGVEDAFDSRYSIPRRIMKVGFSVAAIATAEAGIECASENGYAPLRDDEADGALGGMFLSLIAKCGSNLIGPSRSGR
ncbi:MAG: hypothetical protein WAZ18_06225 [Alphaproteobacteria bacterium]